MREKHISYVDKAQKSYDGSAPGHYYELATGIGATYPLPPGLAAMLDYGRRHGDISIAELRGISDWILDCLNEALLPRETTKTIGSTEAIQLLIADTAIAYTKAANANPDAATLAAHRDRWPCLVPKLADTDGNKAFEEQRKTLGIGKHRLRVGSPVDLDGITPTAGRPKKMGSLANQFVKYYFEQTEEEATRCHAGSSIVPATQVADGWTRPREAETAKEWFERVVWPRVQEMHLPKGIRRFGIGYYCSRSHPELDPAMRYLLESVGIRMGMTVFQEDPKRLEPHFKAVHYVMADWGIEDLRSFFRGRQGKRVTQPAPKALDIWTCEQARLVGEQWLEWYRTNATDMSGDAFADDHHVLSGRLVMVPFCGLRSLGVKKGSHNAELSLRKDSGRVSDMERFEVREKSIYNKIRKSLLVAAGSLVPPLGFAKDA